MDILFSSLALLVFVTLSGLRLQPDQIQWLIFERNYDIYRILPNGTQRLNLTASANVEYFQSLSPDGQWIIFLRDEGNSRTIYRMRTNGAQPERLTPPTDPPYRAQFAAWTPDGQWLLYTFGSNIFRMHPDGTERQQLTDTDRVESVAGISPDGQWIIEQSIKVTDRRLYRMRPDGSERQVILSSEDEFGWFEQFSPDGKWLFYSCEGGGGAYDRHICRVHLDGSGLQRLASYARLESFTPDGERMIFQTDPGGAFNTRMYSALLDGTDGRQIGEQGVQFQSWTPDGKWMIYSFKGDLYRMRPDGSEPQQLTHSPETDTFAAWSPDGEWMIYQASPYYGRDFLYRMHPDGTQKLYILLPPETGTFAGWALS